MWGQWQKTWRLWSGAVVGGAFRSEAVLVRAGEGEILGRASAEILMVTVEVWPS